MARRRVSPLHSQESTPSTTHSHSVNSCREARPAGGPTAWRCRRSRRRYIKSTCAMTAVTTARKPRRASAPAGSPRHAPRGWSRSATRRRYTLIRGRMRHGSRGCSWHFRHTFFAPSPSRRPQRGLLTWIRSADGCHQEFPIAAGKTW